MERARTIADLAARALAALLLASMLVAALHDVSQLWDVWYYHWPFAARLGGILPASAYAFHPANEARFAGYPLLGELLQGLLWRATGHAACANLVAFASVPLLSRLLARRFRVPMHLSVLALLAIPLVQLHATSCYVDLPASTGAAVLVLLTIDAWASASPPSAGTLALAGVGAGVAINMRFQLAPLVLVTLVALAARALPPLFRSLSKSSSAPSRARARRVLTGIVMALPLVFATPLRNAAIHHNPFYPEHLHVAGIELPGPEEPYSASPPWLAHAPRPVRFAASLLEMGIRPMTSRKRWTIDQWMPDDSTGNRMGGFFHAYVVANLLILALRALRDRRRLVRAGAAGFVALTALVAFMPQSHELRYYMVWMIALVALNLALACTPGAEAVEPGRGLLARIPPAGPGALLATSVAALVVVLAVTRGGYVYASGSTFDEMVRAHADERALGSVRDGERICVRREPWNLLWAAKFHGGRHYVVQSAEHAGECAGMRSFE